MFWIYECVLISLYTNLELTAINEREKDLILYYIFSKIPRMFCKEFQICKTTFLNLIIAFNVKLWITAFNFWAWIDNFKYQILTFQKVADEKYKYFSTILIFKIELQLIGYLTFSRQVRWFIKWWVESSTINSDSSLTQSIIR